MNLCGLQLGHTIDNTEIRHKSLFLLNTVKSLCDILKLIQHKIKDYHQHTLNSYYKTVRHSSHETYYSEEPHIFRH